MLKGLGAITVVGGLVITGLVDALVYILLTDVIGVEGAELYCVLVPLSILAFVVGVWVTGIFATVGGMFLALFFGTDSDRDAS